MMPQPGQMEEMRRVLSDNPSEFDPVVEFAARDHPELGRRMASGRSHIFGALDVLDRVLDHDCRVKYEQLGPEQQRVVHRVLREFRGLPAGGPFMMRLFQAADTRQPIDPASIILRRLKKPRCSTDLDAFIVARGKPSRIRIMAVVSNP